MSPGLVVLVIVAVLFAGLGVQLTARQLQRYPVDVRKVGPLIDTARTKSWTVRPIELETMHSIVSEALISDAALRAKLHPLLDELSVAGTTRPGSHSTRAALLAKASGRRGRTRRLEEQLRDLEQAWALIESDDGEDDGNGFHVGGSGDLPLTR